MLAARENWLSGGAPLASRQAACAQAVPYLAAGFPAALVLTCSMGAFPSVPTCETLLLVTVENAVPAVTPAKTSAQSSRYPRKRGCDSGRGSRANTSP